MAERRLSDEVLTMVWAFPDKGRKDDVRQLAARITKLEAVVAAAMDLADALPYDAMVHRDVKPAFERLAAAKAELEREQGGPKE